MGSVFFLYGKMGNRASFFLLAPILKSDGKIFSHRDDGMGWDGIRLDIDMTRREKDFTKKKIKTGLCNVLYNKKMKNER